MSIPESSLYTILPKYLVDQLNNATANTTANTTVNATINITFNVTLNDRINLRINISKLCHIQKPPYFIVSMVFLSKNLAQVVSNLIIGCIIEKINHYFILIAAQCFGIGVALIYAFGNSVVAYMCGRVLDAFVNAASYISILAIISSLFSDINTRGRYIGLGNTLYFFSHSIGAVYGAEIDTRLGKSPVFFLLIPLWIVTISITISIYSRVKDKVKYGHEIKKCDDKETIEIENLNNENTSEYPAEVINSVQNPDKDSDFCPKKAKPNKSPLISIMQMLKTPSVLICLIQLFIVNFSMFALPATLPSWMGFRLCATEIQQGLVWAFGFIGYVSGVGLVTLTFKYAPKFIFYTPIIAQMIIGILLILLPFSHDWRLVFIPIIGMYFCVGIVEQVIFPLTTHLADRDFNSDYGTMSSLTSQSLTICGVMGTLSSGPIAERFGFHTLSIALGILNLTFCGLHFLLRNSYNV